jgi:hypothetical protein
VSWHGLNPDDGCALCPLASADSKWKHSMLQTYAAWCCHVPAKLSTPGPPQGGNAASVVSSMDRPRPLCLLRGQTLLQNQGACLLLPCVLRHSLATYSVAVTCCVCTGSIGMMVAPRVLKTASTGRCCLLADRGGYCSKGALRSSRLCSFSRGYNVG